MRRLNLARSVAAAIGLSLLLTLWGPGAGRAAFSAPLEFADIAGHWAQREVELLGAKGVIEPLSGSDYHPDVSVNRADLAKMLVIGLGHGDEVDALIDEPSTFRDVPYDHPDRVYIELAYELGIVNGYPGRLFMPDADITRAEMTAMVLRALGWEKLAQSMDTSTVVYPDQASIDPWALGYAVLARRTGIVKGFTDGTFQPLGLTTRAQTATLIARMLAAMGRLYDVAGTVETADLVDGAVIIETATRDRRLVVYPRTPVYRNGIPADLGQLSFYDELLAVLDDSGRAVYIDARLATAAGTLEAYDPAGLTITLGVSAAERPSGAEESPVMEESRSFIVEPGAAVFRNGSAASLGDLRPGDRIVAILKTADGSNAVRAVDAVQTTVAGAFERYDRAGQKITIEISGNGGNAGGGDAGSVDAPEHRTYGVTQSTSIYLAGQKIQPADLTPGDLLELAVDDKGTTAVFITVERPR